MASIKILFVIPSLSTGGTNSSLNSIYNILNSKGDFDISVFCISHSGTFESSYNQVILPEKKFFTYIFCNYSTVIGNIKYFIAVIKFIKRFLKIFGICLEKITENYFARKIDFSSYDIVVAFQEGYATSFVSKIDCQNKIAWIHCNYKYYSNAYKEYDVYNQFQKIVCVSKFTAQEFSDVYPYFKYKTDYIHNLFDIDSILYKSTLDINDERFKQYEENIILSIGRIDPIKRFNLIPEIASKLKQKELKFCWYIIGPENSKQEYELLTQNINRYDVISDVIYLGSKNNPYPFLKSASLLVSTSISEACPMIFNEAMVLKIPIITTNFGSSYEFIRNWEDGIICPIEEIHNHINNILSNKEYYSYFKQKLSQIDIDNKSTIAKLENLFLTPPTNI